MNEEIIKNIQQQILQLLPADQRNRPGVLLADSCSEISRLVAGWIKLIDESIRIAILKGVNVCGTKKSHDIVTATTIDNQVYIIDPTIWQFFPQAESILALTSDDINIALDKIKAMYGGQWAKSEEFVQMDKTEEKKYLDIIAQNIRENLK